MNYMWIWENTDFKLNMKMFQVHLFISGRVQGVGYRKFVRAKAKKLQLFGFVQNLPDGRVEAVVQGKKESILNLITQCRQGPFLAEVTHIQEEWEEVSIEFVDFEIKHLCGCFFRFQVNQRKRLRISSSDLPCER